MNGPSSRQKGLRKDPQEVPNHGNGRLKCMPRESDMGANRQKINSAQLTSKRQVPQLGSMGRSYEIDEGEEEEEEEGSRAYYGHMTS
jgi:hypothetical protein